MIHFQSKNNIIDWLIQNCPRKAVVRALIDGDVEFLGGFRSIPPSILPGWILRVTSIYGKKWNIVVLANDVKHCYEIRIIKSIPWKNWIGLKINIRGDNILLDELFCGDNPEKYEELRNAKI